MITITEFLTRLIGVLTIPCEIGVGFDINYRRFREAYANEIAGVHCTLMGTTDIDGVLCENISVEITLKNAVEVNEVGETKYAHQLSVLSGGVESMRARLADLDILLTIQKTQTDEESQTMYKDIKCINCGATQRVDLMPIQYDVDGRKPVKAMLVPCMNCSTNNHLTVRYKVDVTQQSIEEIEAEGQTR